MLRALTYRIHGLDNAFISPPPKLFRLETLRKHPASLGDLDGCPLELLHEVLTLLDLQSIASFRIVNTRTMWIVEALSQYNILVEQAPEVLWALVATGVASHLTISNLFETLCTPACAGCGDFGAFFFLPEFKRCCVRCLTVGDRFMPMSVPEAKRIFRLSAAEIAASVPIVHTVPGRYTLSNRKRMRRRQLISKWDAEDIWEGQPDGIALDKWHRKHYVKGSVGKCWFTGPGHIDRFLCAAPFPYFDPITRKAHRGVFCKGCEIAMERKYGEIKRIRWRREEDEMFSDDGFLDHFKQCRDAQEMWESHKESEPHSN